MWKISMLPNIECSVQIKVIKKSKEFELYVRNYNSFSFLF